MLLKSQLCSLSSDIFIFESNYPKTVSNLGQVESTFPKTQSNLGENDKTILNNWFLDGIFPQKKAYGVRVSNIEKNIHSKNHAFEKPIVLTLSRYGRFCERFSKNTLRTASEVKKQP